MTLYSWLLTRIINCLLQSGHFAKVCKEALVFPLLKKLGMEFIFDNLSATYPLYQILRRELHSIRHVHMSTNNLYPSAQSSYRKNHSTETALLKVKNDILLNMNRQHTTFLVLLDLSAAFDTVDHGIMLERLSSKLHLCDTALDWFQ